MQEMPVDADRVPGAGNIYALTAKWGAEASSDDVSDGLALGSQLERAEGVGEWIFSRFTLDADI